uniref:Active regulator of SIRT1 n=1 Tax=Pogona vitticeps TaxID=103695 RepID=A0A6J0UYR2_9SAUR
MSASLLRRGLELLETTGATSSCPKKAATAAEPRQQLRRRRKKFSASKRDTSTIKGRVIKSALDEYKKHQAIDHFQENLEYMTNSQYITDSTITQKVLAQNRGRKAKDRPKEEPTKKPEGTVFTEEDFQRFEKEYFGGGGAV